MKNRSFMSFLVAGLLGLGLSNFVQSAEPPGAPASPEGQKQMTPEEVKAKREANRKMFRERMVKRIDELKKKKADGTITEKESRDLDLYEKRLATFDQQWSKEAQTKPADNKQPAAPEKK